MPKSQLRNLALLLFSACAGLAAAQQPQSPPQPPPALNASISDFGTSFIFDPPTICAKCIETELGFLSLQDGRYAPLVVTVAPFKTPTDFSLLVNMLDSESPANRRAAHFGDRIDFVIRQQLYTRGGFVLTLAPRGAVFLRGGNGGRLGGAVAPQYSKGNNLVAVNLTVTAGIAVSPDNPSVDYVGAADYYRTLTPRGYQLFLGAQHEAVAGQQTAGTEEGFVIPFRNGQVELSAQQLDLNTRPEFQFQARVIVNWGKVLARK